MVDDQSEHYLAVLQNYYGIIIIVACFVSITLTVPSETIARSKQNRMYQNNDTNSQIRLHLHNK